MSAKKAEHFKLRDGQSFVLNLAGARIPGASLPGTMLNYAQFEGCNLASSNFDSAMLQHANFKDAELSNSNFNNADLSNANFRNANLKHAEFRGAQLKGINLTSATISNCDFRGVDLSQAEGLSVYSIMQSQYDDTTRFSEEFVEAFQDYIRKQEEYEKQFKEDRTKTPADVLARIKRLNDQE